MEERSMDSNSTTELGHWLVSSYIYLWSGPYRAGLSCFPLLLQVVKSPPPQKKIVVIGGSVDPQEELRSKMAVCNGSAESMLSSDVGSSFESSELSGGM